MERTLWREPLWRETLWRDEGDEEEEELSLEIPWFLQSLLSLTIGLWRCSPRVAQHGRHIV